MTAIDRTSAAGTIIIQVHGELPPTTGLFPVTPDLMTSNVQIYVSDMFRHNGALETPLEQIENLSREVIAVAFAQDWRQRAVASGYLSMYRVKLEPVGSSRITEPTTQRSCLPASPPLSTPRRTAKTPVGQSGAGQGLDYHFFSPPA